jgi:hypothetical protein
MVYQSHWIRRPTSLQKPVGLTIGYKVESFCFNFIGREKHNKKLKESQMRISKSRLLVFQIKVEKSCFLSKFFLMLILA